MKLQKFSSFDITFPIYSLLACRFPLDLALSFVRLLIVMMLLIQHINLCSFFHFFDRYGLMLHSSWRVIHLTVIRRIHPFSYFYIMNCNRTNAMILILFFFMKVEKNNINSFFSVNKKKSFCLTLFDVVHRNWEGNNFLIF